MPAEIITEEIKVTQDEPATRELGKDEFVHVSAPLTGGLMIIEEMRFTDESGERYHITEPQHHRGSVAMNTRDGKTVYEFSRE